MGNTASIQLNRYSIAHKLIQGLLIYSCLTIIFVMLKNTVSPIFGVIKDLVIFCSLFLLVNVRSRLSRIHLNFISIFFIISLCSLFTSLSYSNLIYDYVYQYKIDLFYVISILVFSLLFFNIKEQEVRTYLKIIVTFSLLNAIVAIAQRIFMFKFLGLVGFEDLDASNIPALGNVDGLVLQTQNGLFRSIGMMSTPMASAELSLIGLFIFLYYKFKLSVFHLFIVCVFIVSIYFTGYKTVYLSCFAIIVSFVIPWLRLSIIRAAGIVLFAFGFLSVNTSLIYNLTKNISPLYAEYSIRLRLEFVTNLFEQQLQNFPFGLYAQNGNYLRVTEGAVPLDSMYIYTLSNYGFIGLVLSFLLLLVLFINMKVINIYVNSRAIPVGQYVFIFFASNYFFNQPFVNFPSGWHALILLMLALMQGKKINKYVDYQKLPFSQCN